MSSETSQLPHPCLCKCEDCYKSDARYVRKYRQWVEEDPEHIVRAIIEALNRSIKQDKEIIKLQEEVSRLTDISKGKDRA